MNTISQSEILLQDATNEVGSFFRKYQISDILKQCNGYKQKGFLVIANFPGFYNSKGKSELIKLCFPGMLESRLWISCSYESH